MTGPKVFSSIGELVRHMTGKDILAGSDGKLYVGEADQGSELHIRQLGSRGGADRFAIIKGDEFMTSAYDCPDCGIVEGSPEKEGLKHGLLKRGEGYATRHRCGNCYKELGIERD
jgi:hypothetical protein